MIRSTGLATILLLAACTQSPSGPVRPSGPTAGGVAGTPSVLPPTDATTLRFQKVDMLVSQWDVAQAGGRAEQADALAAQTRAEVDGGMQDFLAASRGERGLQYQYLAVSALGFASRPEATAALLERLADNDARLVGNALIALKIRADPSTPLAPILRLVSTQATEPRRYAPLAIANIAEARFRTGNGIDPEMQRRAAHVLSGVVADRDPYVRLHVAKAISALRTPGSYELLMILMKDEYPRIRIAAAAGLERLGDPRGFPECIRLLDDVSADYKPMVAEILVSYAERLQRMPLSQAERDQYATSPQAWSQWLNAYTARTGASLTDAPPVRAPAGPPLTMPVPPPRRAAPAGPPAGPVRTQPTLPPPRLR